MGEEGDNVDQPKAKEASAGTAKEAPEGPRDPYLMVLIIFKILGMGCLLPWNFFISVNDYWMHKFRNVTDVVDFSSSGSNFTITVTEIGAIDEEGLLQQEESLKQHDRLSDLQIQWNSYLSIASMIPNVFFLLLNAVIGHHFRTQPRIIVAMVVIVGLFIFTSAMAVVDTDVWQYDFLYLTLASVVVINIMVAILQGGLTGIAANFPPHYMGSVIQGQALGGIFAAGTNVIMIAIGGTSQSSAFYCFIITVGFLTFALGAYLFVTRTEFFKYYIEHRNVTAGDAAASNGDVNPEVDRLIPEGANGAAAVLEPAVRIPQKVNVLHIAGQIWVWILAVFLTFLVTLAVFPAITALVKSTEHGKGRAWNDIYFVAVGCFLLFNVGDYCGRILASFLQWPKATRTGSWIILAISVARFAFLPLFLVCNVSPNNRVNSEVYIHSDLVYLLAMCLFSLSNGYVGSIAMMFAPKVLPEGQPQSTAASIMVSFLVLGLAIGAALSSVSLMLL